MLATTLGVCPRNNEGPSSGEALGRTPGAASRSFALHADYSDRPFATQAS